MKGLWKYDLIFVLAIIVMGFLLSGCDDLEAAHITAEIEAETSERRALPPEEIAYWKRHERNSRLCRDQQYVSQCCDSSMDSGTLTCLYPKEIR